MPLEILKGIQKDLKEKFDNDPAIMRVANMIVNEFKIRTSEQSKNTIISK